MPTRLRARARAPEARRALALIALLSWMPWVALALSDSDQELQSALRLTPQAMHGAQLFELCAACHGRDATGAPDGSVPAIAGQPAAVLLKQIVSFRHEKRLNIRMAHFVNHQHLSEAQDLADVAAYVSALPPRSPRESATGSARVAQGAALYADTCQSCHGRSAQADAVARIPRLAGQYPQYLEQQIKDAAEGLRPSMARDHARLLQRWSEMERAAVAAYLAQLAPESSQGPSDR